MANSVLNQPTAASAVAAKVCPRLSVENCDRHLAINGCRQCHAGDERGGLACPDWYFVLRSINTRSAK
jgi:hypothetical protein